VEGKTYIEKRVSLNKIDFRILRRKLFASIPCFQKAIETFSNSNRRGAGIFGLINQIN